MKYLLDSLTFLWWCSDSAKLSRRAFDLIKNRENIVCLSLLSVREIQIKSQLGLVDLPIPLIEIYRQQRDEHHFQVLAIELGHMEAMVHLPNYHIDPFDRVLIAQAMADDLTLVTQNPNMAKYPVKIVW
ncbi:MAG: PIN domain nuclease [Anaerolineaceae bacterium]|nr:PIN domain nuclease [Anaerolineaceae bacterium]